MVLRAGYLVVATKIQEAATAMCHEDIRTRLSDAINDLFRGTGNWGYIVAVFGDDKAGDVVYSCNSDLKKAPYSIAGTGGAVIDTAKAVDVQPLTTYEVETAETGVTEAGARNSKHDLMQLQTIHDSAAALGANCSMKESQQQKEEARTESQSTKAGGVETASLKLLESCAFSADITIREAFTPGRLVKLIAPGKGSSAYYTVEALQQAARDKIFHAGLPMRIDHPTRAEEAARPEGSVKDWGAVLESDAVYRDDLPSGQGLYAPIKKFSDHAQIIDEKGPYAGVSIRANGNAVTESGKPVMREGVPVLKEFTSAEGADMVTRAGAGGMFLSESARTIPTQEAAGMSAEEVRKLVESALVKDRLPEVARAEATRLLEGISLKPETKQDIIEGVLRGAIPVKEDGSLNTEALGPLVVAEAQRIGRILSREVGTGVRGMGIAPAAPAPKPEEIAAREATRVAEETEMISVYESMGMPHNAAVHAAKGRAA